MGDTDPEVAVDPPPVKLARAVLPVRARPRVVLSVIVGVVGALAVAVPLSLVERELTRAHVEHQLAR